MWSRLDARLAGAVLGRDDARLLEARSAALIFPHSAPSMRGSAHPS